ncbi:MAG: hypothetical protein R3F49_04860 [Planctomycetota bacterium]
MIRRISLLTRALLAGVFGGSDAAGAPKERIPVAPLVFLAALSALVAGLVRAELGPYPMALVGLALSLALGALPLLGELAPLLRADPAAEWVGALPVRPREVRVARTLALAWVAGGIAVATILPTALMARDLALAERALLVLAAVAQAWSVAALLLWTQKALGERGEALLTLVQAALLVLVLVGLMLGLRSLPQLAQLEAPTRGLLGLPCAWFAAPFARGDAGGATGLALALAFGATVFAVATFALAPFPPAPRARPTRSALGVLLTPARRLAELVWVTPRERGPFALVYEALPAERDFAIRTWPLVALPLAFLFLGADPTTLEGRGLWVLLLFAPVAYLPFVLMHVPVTATPAARWLVDTAPIKEATELDAARKAVAVRVLLPLHVGLGALAAAQVDVAFALTLTPVAVAFGLLTLRLLYRPPQRAPLSTPPSELAGAYSEGLAGSVMTVGIVASLIGIVAWRALPNAWVGWVALGCVLSLEALLSRPTRHA